MLINPKDRARFNDAYEMIHNTDITQEERIHATGNYMKTKKRRISLIPGVTHEKTQD